MLKGRRIPPRRRKAGIGLLAMAILAAGCATPAPAPRNVPAETAPAVETRPAQPARPPDTALAVLETPRLTKAEIAQFVGGLLTVPIERRTGMADTLYRAGFADLLLPPHLWVYVQRFATRDMDSPMMSAMGMGFHVTYTHFAEPTLFFFVEELKHGSGYHKFEIDFFLQYVTLNFEDLADEPFHDPGWVSKRANRWLAWIAAHQGGNRIAWAMEALRDRRDVHPERVFKVLEELTGLKPFPDAVDVQKPEDVARRAKHWLDWWAANGDYVYWFEDEAGPVQEGFPAWWNSTAGKQQRERGLYRVDLGARAAGVPEGEYRKAHPWVTVR